MNLIGRFKGRQTQRCPRCGEKCLISQNTCPECGLIFARMENASNKDAVKRLKQGEKHNVLMSTKVPYDKKYWKLLLYSTVLGLFGVQYFYVHRWKMGLYMIFGFIVTLMFGTIFNGYAVTWWNGNVMNYLIAPYVGVYAIVWLNSIRQVVFRSFKIPVSLPYKEFNVVEEDK